MGLLRWMTRNWADTDEGVHADLRPLELPLPPAEALPRIAGEIRGLPRWKVESLGDGALTATRRTRLWKLIDDITVRLEPTPAGCRLHARSESRVGKGDLGQNRRNLLELFAAVRHLRSDS